MPDQIKIASLKIDNKQIIDSLSATKKQIDELSESQKELQKSGKSSSEQFVKQDAQLKTLRGEYTNQIKALQATTGATDKLNSELQKETKSIDGAVENNKKLRQIRNGLNTETEEGAKAIDEINKKINANTEYINENSSSLEQQKNNIGNYKEDIKGAASELDVFNGGLGNLVQKSQETGGAGKAVTGVFQGMAKGLLSATKAALAFVATPIGALLAALVGAFALVKNAMNRSETATNKIRKAFSAFSGIINGVLKVLAPLGDFLIDGIVKGMELAERGIYKAMEGIAKGLDFLGFDEKAKQLRDFNNEVQESGRQAKALTDAQIDLEKSQRKARITQLEFQKDAEKLRQIRDDESKSIAERKKANEDLGATLKKQSKEELAIAQKAVDVANLRLQLEGKTKEALDARAEALTEVADIQERITGQESEQLVNRVALQKEAADKAHEIADKAIADQQEQLDLFIASQGIKAKSLEESLAFQKKVSEKELAILDAELKAGNISRTKYDEQAFLIKNDLLAKQAELAVDNAQRELQDYIANNQSKLDSDKFFTEQSLIEEQVRLDAIAEKRKEFAATQLEEGVIDQIAYNTAIAEVEAENEEAKKELLLERKEAQAEADAIDYENYLAINAERAAFDLAFQTSELEKRKQAELKNAESTGASTTLIESKYAEQKKAIERAVTNNKLQLAGDALNNVAEILGKESKAGKAAAIAQTLITTYQSATNAFNSLSVIPIVGTVLGALAAGAAVASGLANIKKIRSTPDPKAEKATVKRFAKGGILYGRSHANGGIPTPMGELEGGEAVINKRSTAMFAPLLSSLNQMGGGKRFANGGILGSQAMPTSIIDYDEMARAYGNVPAPIVSVQEISSVNNRVSVIEDAASF